MAKSLKLAKSRKVQQTRGAVMKPGVKLLLGAISLSIVVGIFAAPGHGGAIRELSLGEQARATQPSGQQARSDLRAAMRTLWSYHAWYTREYYVAAVLGTANTDAAATRLLKNQEDIGNAIATYYGKEAGDKVTSLLQDHIKIATEVVAAAKTGDQAKLKHANDRWHQNFVDLAKLLSTANPSHFPYDETLQLLNQHLSLLTTAVVSFIGGDYAQSITDNDAYYDEILMMSDFFTDGIIKQFPEKFQ